MAPYTAVAQPTTVMTIITDGASTKTSLRRATRYTPEVTMVAAWISAETGVGPAMASGSQVSSGSWALLPVQPRKSSAQAATISGVPISAGPAEPWKNTAMSA